MELTWHHVYLWGALACLTTLSLITCFIELSVVTCTLVSVSVSFHICTNFDVSIPCFYVLWGDAWSTLYTTRMHADPFSSGSSTTVVSLMQSRSVAFKSCFHQLFHRDRTTSAPTECFPVLFWRINVDWYRFYFCGLLQELVCVCVCVCAAYHKLLLFAFHQVC